MPKPLQESLPPGLSEAQPGREFEQVGGFQYERWSKLESGIL